MAARIAEFRQFLLQQNTDILHKTLFIQRIQALKIIGKLVFHRFC